MGHILTFQGETHMVRALARFLMERYHKKNDPLALANVRLLLPNNRSISQLKYALYEENNGQTLLLPRCSTLAGMHPLDWLDPSYVPPRVIASSTRLAWMAKMVQPELPSLLRHASDDQDAGGMVNALRYARSFLGLRDDCQYAQLDSDALKQLVPDDYAQHWEQMLSVFYRLNQRLDQRLNDAGLVESVQAQHAFVTALEAQWDASPPAFPVIVAGSTASTRTSARIIQAVTRLPQGCVMLPGLDMVMDDGQWEAVSPSHPQYFMKRLLEQTAVTRDEVECIRDKHHARDVFISRVMLPEQACGTLHRQPVPPEVIRHIELMQCQDGVEEAEILALRVHDALARGQASTITVVSEMDSFVRRFSASLAAHDIAVNRAAGVQINHHEAFHSLMLTAQLLYRPYASVILLAWLRHPYHVSERQAEMRALATFLDSTLLRGCHNVVSLEDVLQRAAMQEGLASICAHLQAILLHDNAAVGFAALRDTFIAVMQSATQHILQDDAHVMHPLLRLVAEFGVTSQTAMRCAAYEFPDVMAQLLDGIRLPVIVPDDCRVSIMGPMEARFHLADMVIIPHMNEGFWPVSASSEPWLNIAMRHQLGLPTYERLMALAGHDVCMMMKAPMLVMSYAGRQHDKPVLPSRYVERFMLAAQQMTHVYDVSDVWRRQLQRYRLMRSEAQHSVIRIDAPPAPTVALSQRTWRYSATAIERLSSNPFAYFSRHLCRLREREMLDAPMDNRLLGNILHAALERASVHYRRDTFDAYINAVTQHINEAIAQYVAPAERRFYDAMIAQLADRLRMHETERLTQIDRISAEQAVNAAFALNAGTLHLSARVDRIECRLDGSHAVVDFKTNNVPSNKELSNGDKCQLLIAAMILRTFNGLYNDIRKEYWQLLSDKPGLVVDGYSKMSSEELLNLEEKLLTMLVRYSSESDVCYPWDYKGALRDTMEEQFARVGEW